MFAAPGALDAPCAVSYGPVPGSVYAGHRFLDVLIHGWDLAKATGQNTNLAPELAGQLLIGAKNAISPAFRSPEGNPFGPEQTAPEGASNADELAAFLTERHSYDEPEIIALPIVTGSAAYLTWMREETRRADGTGG